MKSFLEQKYPRIASKLVQVWQEPTQAEAYLDSLLFKEKDRAYRRGFEGDILVEIMLLSSLVTNPSPEDVWQFSHHA